MNVSHGDRCPACNRPRAVAIGAKRSERFCWKHGGEMCLATQLAYERACAGKLRAVVEQSRRLVAMPCESEAAAALLRPLTLSLIALDAVEPPRVTS